LGCIKPLLYFWPHDIFRTNTTTTTTTTKRTRTNKKCPTTKNDLNDSSADNFEIPLENFGSLKFVGSGPQGCVFKTT
jgi:hypothetical protein